MAKFCRALVKCACVLPFLLLQIITCNVLSVDMFLILGRKTINGINVTSSDVDAFKEIAVRVLGCCTFIHGNTVEGRYMSTKNGEAIDEKIIIINTNVSMHNIWKWIQNMDTLFQWYHEAHPQEEGLLKVYVPLFGCIPMTLKPDDVSHDQSGNVYSL
eukprot:51066_1